MVWIHNAYKRFISLIIKGVTAFNLNPSWRWILIFRLVYVFTKLIVILYLLFVLKIYVNFLLFAIIFFYSRAVVVRYWMATWINYIIVMVSWFWPMLTCKFQWIWAHTLRPWFSYVVNLIMSRVWLLLVLNIVSIFWNLLKLFLRNLTILEQLNSFFQTWALSISHAQMVFLREQL